MLVDALLIRVWRRRGGLKTEIAATLGGFGVGASVAADTDLTPNLLHVGHIAICLSTVDSLDPQLSL